MTTIPLKLPFKINLSRPVNPTGIWDWITTTDHKKIGVLYGVTAFLMFITGGIEALLIRTQLAGPEMKIIAPEVYNQLFTMHATTMIFLGVMPLSAAFFNYIIPLQIGARDVAFPRLNAFSYWTFLFGALIMKSSWFLGGSPNAGWFGYAPITTTTFNAGHGIDFWVVGLQVLGVASLAASFNFIVTIINMRAPGMSFMRLPLFTWMTFITAILLVLAFPVITVALIELMLDRTFDFNFFNTSAGANPLLWQHLFWIFGHPEVYILILPAMGIVSEILPTFSKKPIFGYAAMVLAAAFIAFMGWLVWSHHMFTTGLGPIANSVFTITTMLIAVPTGVKMFNWIGTMWGGNIEFNTPTLFSVGFLSMFLIGGISGVMHSFSASDYQQQDTYFIVAHLHYVLFGGAIFGIFGGIYYWFPKITGRMYDEKMGKLNFWLMFIGQNLTFFPMHFIGMQGMPRRIFTYDANMGWAFWNGVETFSAYVIAFGVLFFMINMLKSWGNGPKAGDDPWDGRTLEWSISSPPPVYNFLDVPKVEALDDFWVKKQKGITKIKSKTKPKDIHLPQASYWPMLVALGLTIAAYGIIYNLVVCGLGIAMVLITVCAWSFEPVNEPEAH